MRNWLRRVASWLAEAKLLWVATGIPIAFLLPVLFLQLTEPQTRLVGLLLQLLGLSTVLHGISQTSRLFNLPPPAAVASNWLKSFPRFRMEGAIGRMIGQVGELNLAGRVEARHQAGANATLEDRVRVLESNFGLLDQRVYDVQGLIDETNRRSNEALATERHAREHDFRDLSEKLTLTETGGLYISLMGLIWLMLGLIITTASLEISRAL